MQHVAHQVELIGMPDNLRFCDTIYDITIMTLLPKVTLNSYYSSKIKDSAEIFPVLWQYACGVSVFRTQSG